MSNQNPSESAAKQRQASAIIAHLRANGIGASHLATMHPQEVAHHLMAAGHADASSETMGLVYRGLGAAEEEHRRSSADPFAGL